MKRTADIVIFGAGIAGLWSFHHFKSLGYDVLLLESDAIGNGQTIASQGIIHSGLKYAFAGKINTLAQSISAMPDLWRAALRGEGVVNLSAARANADSQYLLIPSGFMGGLITLVTQKALGGNVREVPKDKLPEAIKASGFKGRVVFMDEPVLDVPSVLKALAEPYKNSIRKIDTPADPLGFLEQHGIEAKQIVFTSAASNAKIAARAGHDKGLATQARPLVQAMLKPAPFEFYAHLVGPSDKPVATITTHQCKDGTLAWYLGGSVAERPLDSDPQDAINFAKNGFAKYLPHVDLTQLQWATLPIDRIEGKSEVDGWMPDTPTIHSHENVHYCWPTKLTFAPLLAQRLAEKITHSPSATSTDWSFLEAVDYAAAPWDKARWTK